VTTESEGPRGHLALLSLGALGIVYGDIGTSPLYAFREAIHATGGQAADQAGVLGLLSMVFWALLIVVTIKYMVVVMRADNHGEGGILALTALILPSSPSPARRRQVLIWFGLFGTALLYGDGIITPAISVLAAVEGLEVAAPSLGPWVVPIAIAILIGLFAVQRRGTGAVGRAFGPVMVLWFGVLALLGVPGRDRRRGAVRGHGALRSPPDRARLVLARAARVGAGDRCDRDRVAGADLRRVLADDAGRAVRLPAATPDRAHLGA
jgi:KUP system potassium uptake protein